MACMSSPRTMAPAGEVYSVDVVHYTSGIFEQYRVALTRHGVPEEVQAGVFEALVDPVFTETTSSTLTEAEKAFALSAGIPESAFSPEAAAANKLYEAQSAAADVSKLQASVLTTREVANRLGIPPDNVRQQLQRGSLYAVALVSGRKALPQWQFTDAGPLPGLREVLAALPRDFHPLDVESVMTEPDESLGDRSPREWLATGGAVEPVLRLLSGLSYT